MRTAAHGTDEPGSDRFSDTVPVTIDRELELIRTAIAMVASGGSPRVVVAGLRFGDQILPRAQAMAYLNGLQVTPQWTLDENQTSIAVERRRG